MVGEVDEPVEPAGIVEALHHMTSGDVSVERRVSCCSTQCC
jgi:hypothetical protein